MARRSVPAGMTQGEKIRGGCLLAVYFAALPLAADPMFDLLEKWLRIALGEAVRNAAYHYILFALTLIVFWGWLGRAVRAALDRPGAFFLTVGAGLVAFYGLNEIVFRIFQMFSIGRENLNDQTILARIGSAPRSTILILVFLAPIVEEAVFRGYIFGNLRELSRPAAYLVSCFLFAFVHVWQFVAVHRDFSYLLVMVQYFVPGAVMAWTFERSGSIWGSVLLHCAVNGLAVWSIL